MQPQTFIAILTLAFSASASPLVSRAKPTWGGYPDATCSKGSPIVVGDIKVNTCVSIKNGEETNRAVQFFDMDSSCKATVYTDTQCKDGKSKAKGNKHCFKHKAGWNSYKVEC